MAKGKKRREKERTRQQAKQKGDFSANVHAAAAIVLTAIGAGLLVFAKSRYPLVKPWDGGMMAVGAVFFAAAVVYAIGFLLWQQRCRSADTLRNSVITAGLIFGIGTAGVALTLKLNAWLDFSESRMIRQTINDVDREMRGGGDTIATAEFYVSVNHWERDETLRIRISSSLYDKAGVGDTVLTGRVKPGAFGIEYWTSPLGIEQK